MANKEIRAPEPSIQTSWDEIIDNIINSYKKITLDQTAYGEIAEKILNFKLLTNHIYFKTTEPTDEDGIDGDYWIYKE